MLTGGSVGKKFLAGLRNNSPLFPGRCESCDHWRYRFAKTL